MTVNIGWIAGGLAQPDARSVANGDIFVVGAVTAGSSWIYNRIGATSPDLLVIVLALELWRALSPATLRRLGAGALRVAGARGRLAFPFCTRGPIECLPARRKNSEPLPPPVTRSHLKPTRRAGSAGLGTPSHVAERVGPRQRKGSRTQAVDFL